MKKIISILITFVMVFNLTSEVFAQSVNIKGSNQGHKYFPQTKQAGQEKDKLLQEIEKTHQAQENINRYGITYEDFKKEITAYAKDNKMTIKEADIQASWQDYLKQIGKYERDYLTLAKLFNKKTYLEVITDSDYFLMKSEEKISYDGKKYDRASFLHAAVKNLATRHNTGYFDKDNKAKHMTDGQKIEAMAQIYEIVSREGFNPQDKDLIYNFTYNIVANGKQYFDNDFFVKHNLVPAGLRTARNRQKNEQAKDARQLQASIVAQAMALLPVLSDTSEKKAKSAKAIYEVASKIMRNNYGTIGIVSGAEALIALKTDDSLNKLYTLLSEDLYRGLGTEVTMYVLDSFSIEEWAKRNAAFANGIKNGLGQYHNAIARRFLYIDPKKNSADKIRIASAADESLEAYYNVVYTDILEDIGKTLGSYSKDAKVAALINKLAGKYVKEVEALKARQKNLTIQTDKNGFQTISTSKPDISGKGKGQTAYERESNLHTSLIVGILATTKQKNENLTKAAQIIYNGYWWDLTEATQRDKNNTAAKYLGLQNKGYNAQKQKQFALLTKQKNVGRFADIFVQAAMLGKLIVSIPNIVRAVNNFARRIVNGIKAHKVQPAGLKPVEVNPAQASVQVQPAQKPVLKPAEPAKAPVVEPVKIVEPAKVPAVVEPVKTVQPVKAEVINTTEAHNLSQTQIAKVARDVKGDILGKYYQRPAAMSILPFGIFGDLGKRIAAFLTNKPYLSEAKIKMVRDIADDVARELGGKNLSEEELKAQIYEQVAQKIQADSRFTDAEKAELLKEQQQKVADEAFQTEIERQAKAAEEARQAEIKRAREARLAEIEKQEAVERVGFEIQHDILNGFHSEESLFTIERKIRAFVAKQPYISIDAIHHFYDILDRICNGAYSQVSFSNKSAAGKLVLNKKIEAQILRKLSDAIMFGNNFAPRTSALLKYAITEYVYTHPNPYYSEYWEAQDYINDWNSRDYRDYAEYHVKPVEINIDMNENILDLLQNPDYLRTSVTPTKLNPTRTPRRRVSQIVNLGKLETMDAAKAAKLEAIIDEATIEVEQAIENASSLSTNLSSSIRGSTDGRMATLMADIDKGTFDYAYQDMLIKEKIADKIHQSPDFTAEEKRILTGQTPEVYKAEKLYQESVSIWQQTLPEQISSSSVDQALAKIKEAIELNPKKAKYYAQLYLIQSWRDARAALEAINIAIGLDPTNNTYYIYRGNLLAYRFNDMPAAIADMRTAIVNSNYLGDWSEISYCVCAINEWGKKIGTAKTERALEQSKHNIGIARVSNTIKSNILGPNIPKLPIVPALPMNFLNISKKKTYTTTPISYLTSKPYLSKTKVDKIKTMVEEATKEVEQGLLSEGTIGQSDIEVAIEKRVIEKIQESTDLIAEEKEILLKDLQEKIQKQAAEKARQAELAKQKEIKMKQEQERRAALTENQREAEDLINRAREALDRIFIEYRDIEKAYECFEEAILKEDRLAVKADYLYQEADFLAYYIEFKRKVGNGKYLLKKKTAMLKYDMAIEYAQDNTMKAKYLNERAEFKRRNKDFEGAQADYEQAKRLLQGEDVNTVDKKVSVHKNKKLSSAERDLIRSTAMMVFLAVLVLGGVVGGIIAFYRYLKHYE